MVNKLQETWGERCCPFVVAVTLSGTGQTRTKEKDTSRKRSRGTRICRSKIVGARQGDSEEASPCLPTPLCHKQAGGIVVASCHFDKTAGCLGEFAALVAATVTVDTGKQRTTRRQRQVAEGKK